MTKHTIDISPGVLLELKAMARPFEDHTPEDVIVRLLKERREHSNVGANGATSSGKSSDGLVAGGTLLANGMKLRFSLYGKRYETEVRRGRIPVGRGEFDSPSSAAAAAAAYLGYENRSLNGWHYWEYADERGNWQRLKRLQKTRHARGRRRRRWVSRPT
jgi:hypothetical protein